MTQAAHRNLVTAVGETWSSASESNRGFVTFLNPSLFVFRISLLYTKGSYCTHNLPQDSYCAPPYSRIPTVSKQFFVVLLQGKWSSWKSLTMILFHQGPLFFSSSWEPEFRFLCLPLKDKECYAYIQHHAATFCKGKTDLVWLQTDWLCCFQRFAERAFSQSDSPQVIRDDNTQVRT